MIHVVKELRNFRSPCAHVLPSIKPREHLDAQAVPAVALVAESEVVAYCSMQGTYVWGTYMATQAMIPQGAKIRVVEQIFRILWRDS
jgi:hypothetical protein